MASASSVTRMDGIFGMKISPPTLRSRAVITRSTASGRVIQKRVMRSSVMVSGDPAASCLRNSGTTDPREPTTLP